MMNKPRILSVADEMIVAKDIEHKLEKFGYTVVGIATTGAEAREQVFQKKPDVVLLDVRLPGPLDGIHVAEEIHDKADSAVIFITALDEEVTLQRAKKTEPFGYLIKPIRERELHVIIEIALFKRAAEKRVSKSKQWFVSALESVADAVFIVDTGLIA